MQILVIVAILSSLAARDLITRDFSTVGGWQPLAALGVLLMAPLLAAVSSFATSHALRRDRASATAMRRFTQFQRLVTLAWLLASLASIYHYGYGWAVLYGWESGSWFLIDDLLLLAPAVVPLLLCWAAYYDVDRTLRQIQGSEPSARTRWSYVAFQARQKLLLVLIPVLTLLACEDAASLLAPNLAQSRYGWVIFAAPVMLLGLGFPWLLRWIWQADPLPPGMLRDQLLAAAGHMGLRVRDILHWPTGRRMGNAAVIGFLPRARYVMLSDVLLEQLSPPELEAALAHEAGHVVHRHVWLRVLALLVPAVLWRLAPELAGPWVSDANQQLLQLGIAAELQATLLAVAGMGLYVVLVLSRYSRMLERQADLFSCRYLDNTAIAAHPDQPVPPDYGTMVMTSMLEHVAQINHMSRFRQGWQHDSIAVRVAFMDRMQRDPALEQRFQRRLQVIAGLLLVIVPGGFILQATL